MGAQQRADDAIRNWEVTSAEFGGAVVAGYLLNAAVRRGGIGAHIAKSIAFGAAAGDILGRGFRTFDAMMDTARDPADFERNVQVVAKSAGAAVFDYSLLGLGAYGGAKLNGLMKPRPVEFTIDVSPRNIVDKPRMASPFGPNAPLESTWSKSIYPTPTRLSSVGRPLAVGAAVTLPRTFSRLGDQK